MNSEFVTVASFSDPLSAEITAGMLRANGIPAQVFGQSSPYPSINAVIDSVQVKVNAGDEQAARELLAREAKENEAE